MNLKISIPMPKIDRVVPLKDYSIRVVWKQSLRPNKVEDVDLSSLVLTLKFYRPLRHNAKLFKSVHLIEEGRAIAWGNDDGIDMAATSIERLADESMTATDFRDFLHKNRLTQERAAIALGRSRRQIANYLSTKQPIPRIVSLACYGFEAKSVRATLGTALHGGTHGNIGAQAAVTQTNPVLLQLAGTMHIGGTSLVPAE